VKSSLAGKYRYLLAAENRGQEADLAGFEGNCSSIPLEDYVFGGERLRQLSVAQRAIVRIRVLP
jgi:hypothetical protein